MLADTRSYQDKSQAAVLKQLNTTTDGLTSHEAKKRLAQYGPNAIPEQKRNNLLDFLKRYWDPMPWLLELAIVLTLILGHDTESIIIFVLLTINAVIGFVQSNNSQKAVALLKKKLEIMATVRRDQAWQAHAASQVVPGDIVQLKIGAIVPADLAIIAGNVTVDQSALTGESLPATASAGDLIYSGSIVKSGEVQAVVLNTGTTTYFGQTVTLVKTAKPKSKQEELMLAIVRYMLYLGIAASVIVAIYGLYLHESPVFILSFVLIFLIGSVPVALPAVLTIVQAVGAMALSKKGIIVSRLTSLEDAASIDIFCFDKTGTITQNKLSIIACQPLTGYTAEQLLDAAGLAADQEHPDAIDQAVLNYAAEIKHPLDFSKRQQFTPFDFATKRTEAVITTTDHRQMRVIKGAVPTILALYAKQHPADTAPASAAIQQLATANAKKGYRSLAVASVVDSQMALVGVLAIADPPRADSASMLARLKNLGIKPMMITGDSVPIARDVAEQVGIGTKILPAKALKTGTAADKIQLIHESDGFANVFPDDKYQIVKLLQEDGHLVGMTGDGVNDAPALKQAELGTAVSSASDVAKASASIILTHPGLHDIIAAITTSRQTYQRMLTWVINKITKVIEIIILFTLGFFWLKVSLVSLLGMSLLVFANDFATMSIATDNVQSTAGPNQWRLGPLTAASGVLGLWFALVDLVIVWLGLNQFHLSLPVLQTAVLIGLVFNSQFRLLIVRERSHFWTSWPSRTLLAVNLFTIVIFALLALTGWLMPAISSPLLVTILLLTLAATIVLDFLKVAVFRWLKIA
ncbi:plasma-membrane proton-efflux P-type ATPase [Lacticaseibacillus paracasei]|uniref:plasma-membrane proton-efflux P-type ATPase n=1 Tax=Lacticaseibacillus paracasei TaxID=1597 RepID=UPI00192A7F19|nr:plasma-membrane proton-efflux P-type ATPase [Lacticaseibacillus paracasei]CAD7483554.1 Cation transport ATPase [Lacticaseibacillus paracasei]